MTSKKVSQILKVRTNFSDEQIAGMTESEAWNHIYALDKREKLAKASRHEICFTGFSLSERTELEYKAKERGFEVKSSVTNSLRYLCAGSNAGPAKLVKAKSMGILVLSSQQFHGLCETGEIPFQSEGA